MNLCKKCNYQIEEGLNFCPGCGMAVSDGKQRMTDIPKINNEVTTPCKKCGYQVDDGLRFCPGCGSSVIEKKPMPPPASPPKIEAVAPTPPEKRAGTSFCSNCGNQLTESVGFCAGCGTKIGAKSTIVPVTPPIQSQKPTQPLAQTKANHANMGRLLIEGNGKYNLGALVYWGLSIIADVVILVLGLVAIPDLIAGAPRGRAWVEIGTMRFSIEDMEFIATLLVIVGVIGLIAGIIFSILALRRFQSEIRVYENCIMGKTIQGLAPTVQEFNIPLVDVMNVDVMKQTGIIVRTQYGTYTSYTKKADEIRNVIMQNMG